MAAFIGGFGASGLKVSSSLNLCHAGPKLGASQPFHGLQVRFPRYIHCDGLEMTVRPKRAFLGCQCSASDGTATTGDSPEDNGVPGKVSKVIPKLFEVESLVTDICDTTSIAEFELKLGGFRLYMLRGLTQEETTMPPPVTSPASVNTVVEVPNANGSASLTSLAVSKLESPPSDVESLLVKAADGGLAILKSPKVGFFRRSRTIKGKRAPPSCKEKQQVKEGQVLCYIEQLGGEIPVESDISGEVIRILLEDGGMHRSFNL
ncbi:OLC1v1014641C1 [Oldenlandia corymbosa var. corymbosa]|uniref:OLC1v1014641C1 n=1 Tax=Oldenlandia corymbosa var. corymbosa TaxID=529605 RepID=A0AAV1E4T2_OLDCO|nr:OLC1v1014641C1 [Oldenlandia corymbosa var. corymbosa]